MFNPATEASPLYQAQYAHLRGRGIRLATARRRYGARAAELKRAARLGYVRVLRPAGLSADDPVPDSALLDESHVALAAHLWAIAERANAPARRAYQRSAKSEYCA